MRAILFFFLRAVFRVRLVGEPASIDGIDRLIVVCRYSAALEVLLLGVFLPCHPFVIVPPQVSGNWLLRWALRYVPHEVLDVGSAASLKKILRLVRAGIPVLLFPEGRSSRSGAINKVYPVPALAALRSEAAVVAATIGYSCGTRFAQSAACLMRNFRDVGLHMMPPRRIALPPGGARQRRAHAMRALAAIMQEAALEACRCKPLFECYLDACAEHGRSSPVMEDQNKGVQTYGEILQGAVAIGRLVARCTEDRECVGVLLPNVAVTVQVVLGLSATRRVPVMFNYSSGPSAVRVARSAAGVRTVITSHRFVEQAKLQPLLESLPGCTILYLEDLRSRFGVLDKVWLFAYALRFPRRMMARQSADEPAVVLLTSGSDGEPKGVVLPHRAVVANVVQMRTVIEFTTRDKILNPLPLYHAYSFTAGMVLPLITGTRLYLYISPLHYRAIPEIAYRNDCTVLFGTSTFLAYYAAHANPSDFTRVRYVISGGEKLAPEVARAWQDKFGLRIFEGYGCTECAPVIALATPAAFRSGTVGRFLPGIEYRVEPVSGIRRGGILHLRGPNLMLGHYLEDQPGVLHPCRSPLGAGWYDTGDIVEVDDDGFVMIHGRVRRFAKIAGEMVSLDHIEQIARAASPGHFHAALLKVEEYGGEGTVLFTTDPALDRITLQRAARELGSRDLAVARQIVRVRELPLLRSGKTDYVSLGRMVEEQRPPSREGAVTFAHGRPNQQPESVSQASEAG